MTIRETRLYVYTAAAVLIVADLVVIGILLSPWGKSPGQLQNRLGELKQELSAKAREVAPSRGMDKKLANASGESKVFYEERLPTLYSEIDDALAGAEKESGVHMSNVRYSSENVRREETKVPEGLRKVNLVLTISGEYVQDVKFINALERSKVFFVIQTVSLAGQRNTEQRRMGSSETNVGLQLGVETYLRRGAV